MRTLVVGLVLLSLATSLSATGSSAAEPTARERVERILTDPAADLTREVNALLALGPERVRHVLDDLFVRMREKYTPATRWRAETESLAAILGGRDGDYEPPIWDLGARLGVLDGIVLQFDNAPDGGGFSGNLHYSWEPPKDPLRAIEGGWREPLVPNPKALLARILDPDKMLRGANSGPGGFPAPRRVRSGRRRGTTLNSRRS